MNGRAWSTEDTATLRRMASAGYSDREIANHIHRDRRTVCQMRQRLGIHAGYRPAIIAMMARLSKRRHGLAEAA